jgi:nitrite reductase (NADH) large subunit
MDPEGAHILQAQLESQGFSFYLGAKTQEINGENQVTGITLDSGTFIEGNLVLLSAGIRPDASLAENLGLEIDRGVVVKDTLETSLQDIYAAGDLIQHRDKFYGIWPAAEQQGKVAGINMAGGSVVYPGTTMSNTLKVAGIDLVSSGDIDPEGQQVSIVKKDEEDFIYKKIILADNKIIGAILYGDTRGRYKILKAIEEKKDIGRYLEELHHWEFANI